MYMYIYIYTDIRTYTHIHIYIYIYIHSIYIIYIYIYICVFERNYEQQINICVYIPMFYNMMYTCRFLDIFVFVIVIYQSQPPFRTRRCTPAWLWIIGSRWVVSFVAATLCCYSCESKWLRPSRGRHWMCPGVQGQAEKPAEKWGKHIRNGERCWKLWEKWSWDWF